MPLGMEVGLSPGDFVLDGDPASPPLKGHSPPNFRPMFVVAKQLDGLRWHLVWRYASAQATMFDGDSAAPRTEGTPTTTHFLAHVYCGQTDGWMKTPLGTEVDLGPGHIVLDGVPALRETGTALPPPFSLPVSIVTTVAHLRYC